MMENADGINGCEFNCQSEHENLNQDSWVNHNMYNEVDILCMIFSYYLSFIFNLIVLHSVYCLFLSIANRPSSWN